VASAIVVGVLVFVGFYDKENKKRGQEKETLEDRVRTLYQEESRVLAEKVSDLSDEVKKLRVENEVITKIFQGKDTTTQEFQKQGFEVMKQFAITNQMIAETHNIAVQNKNGLEKMGINIEKLVNILEKNLSSDKK